MNLLIEAILIGLGAWRVSALFSYEKGPFDIFFKFRKFIGFEHRSTGEPIAWPDSFLTNMISCVWCVGLWSAALMWGVWQISQAAVIVLAAAAILISVEKWNHGQG